MAAKEIVHVVAPTSAARAEMARAVFALGHHAEIYGDYGELVRAGPNRGIILAEDIVEQGGIIALVDGMSVSGFWCPVVVTAARLDVRRIVGAIQAGASDYLAPDLEQDRLEEALSLARSHGEDTGNLRREAVRARVKLAELTAREIEVLDLLVAGSSNKTIARELEISPRTVEIHRANMMAKLGAKHAADAIRCRIAAGALTDREAG